MYDWPMYDWDERKRADNLAKHGVDFVEVEMFERDSALTFADGRRQ
jgi:uncharacterized DUF497 family protein